MLAGLEPARPGDLLCVGTSEVVVRPGSAQCTAADDRTAIAPADTIRPFARVEAAGRRVVLGDLPAGAVTLVAAGTAARVRLPVSVSTPETIAGPCALAIAPLDVEPPTVVGPRWTIEIEGKERVRRELSLPRGHYSIAVDCGPDFSAEPIVVDARQGEDESLPAVELSVVALPRISGRIATAEAAGVALLHDGEGRFLGRPEPDGSFRVVVAPERWPASVVISASGYGPVVVPLPPGPTAIELPDLKLKKAARVILSIPPEQLNRLESVEVLQLRGKRERSPYRTLSKAALGESKFTIEVAPGKYLLSLRGTQPLERFGMAVELGAGEERELAIPLADEEIDVRTFLGDRSLGDAEVMMESIDGLWNTTFRTPAEGAMTSHLWQPGKVAFIVQSREVAGHSGTLELRAPRVELRIPTRSVEGKVVDAVTHEPIADVDIVLTDGKGGSLTKSAADGTFRFVGVKPGAYQLSAGGANGLSHETVPVQVLHDETGVRRFRLALRRQQELELEILTSDGRPARGAAVFELSGPAVLSLRDAGEAGVVRLPVSSSVPRSVIVIATDGGLYAQPLSPGRQGSKVRITIPPMNSSISISVGTQVEHPIPGVSLVMRLNGVLFPADAMQLLFARAGIRLTSDENGQIRLPRVPVGLYEFWPIRSRSDLEAILTGHPPAAPIVIAAGPGENKATLGFAAARGTTP